MARPCSICNHPDLAGIDAAIRLGEPYGVIAARFAASKTGVFRHAKAHVATAQVAADLAEAPAFRNEEALTGVAKAPAAPTFRNGKVKSPTPSPGLRAQRPKSATRSKTQPRPGQRKHKAGPDVIATALREEEVFSMRLSGASVSSIAASQGVSSQAMYDFIGKALRRRIQQNGDLIELHRQLELERVDAVQAAIWDIALKAPEMEIEGVGMGKDYAIQLKAVERFTKLSEHRAKLLGIYAPAKHQHAVAVGVKTLGLPTELEAVMIKMRAGDVEARRRIEAYVKTKRLPPPEEVSATVVEATAEPAASG